MQRSRNKTTSSLAGAVYRELFRSLVAHDEDLSTSYASAIDLPRPLARSIVYARSIFTFAPIVENEVALADQISRAVTEWFIALWEEFERLERDTSEFSGMPHDADRTTLKTVLQDLITLAPERSTRWDQLRRALERAEDDAAVERDRESTAIRAEIEETIGVIASERRDRRRERALRQVITPLTDHLNDSITDLAGVHVAVQDLFGFPGEWNIFDTLWQDIDIAAIRGGFERLNAEPGLQRVVDLVTSGSRAHSTTTYPIKIETRSVDRDSPARSTENTRRSTMADLVSRNGAFLASSETEPLFTAQWSRLDRPVGGTAPRRPRPLIREDRSSKLRDSRQNYRPVIVAVDTSGSMRGLPETVAVAFIVGVIREAIRQRRPVRILAFQNGVQELAWPTESVDDGVQDAPRTLGTPQRVPESLLLDLTTMIGFGMDGGTDTSPALERVLTLIETEPIDHADVVVVSDVTTPKITPDHLNRLFLLQRLGRMRFYALTVNREPMSDPLNVFDLHWHYRDADPPYSGIDPETLRGLYLPE